MQNKETENKKCKTSPEKWRFAQETDFSWYMVRMYKDHINAWLPTLDFFKEDLYHPDKVIVEIGCGPTGGILKFMTAQLKIGVEPLANRFLLKGFENIANSEILFLDCLGENIPLVNEFADIICLIHSLGHVQEPEIILAECHRILKTGGQLFVLEILRNTEEITKDHPIGIDETMLNQWLHPDLYTPIKYSTDARIKENQLSLPIFHAIYEKQPVPCDLSAIIDFQSDPFDSQLGGGWYDLESDGRPCRWVTDQFSAYFRREKHHTIFFIEGYAQLSHFDHKQLSISIYMDDVLIGEKVLKKQDQFKIEFSFQAEGQVGRVRIKGACSHYFVPSHLQRTSTDDRELSLVIFKMGFE